jgi:hypothetical protein
MITGLLATLANLFEQKTKIVYMIWFSDQDGRDLQYNVYSNETTARQMFNHLKTLPEYNWYLRLEKVEVIDCGDDGMEEVGAEVLESFYHPEYVD